MMTLKNRISKLEAKKTKGEDVEIMVFLVDGAGTVTHPKTGKVYTPAEWAEYEKDHPDMIKVNQETVKARQS